MTDKRDYRDYLVDILNAINDIDGFIKHMDFKTLINNREKIYAIVFCLQIIGEAVKKIPEEIRTKYKKIPWNKIAGMRDRLSHGYFTIDFEKVWETVKRDLAPLKEIITEIVKKEIGNEI